MHVSKLAMTYKIIEMESNSIDIDTTDITCKDTQYIYMVGDNIN